MRKHGRFERQKQKKSGSGKKVGLIIAAVIVVILLAIVIGAVVIYSNVLGNLTQVTVPEIVYTKPTYDQIETEPFGPQESNPEETTIVTEPPHVASSEDYINFLVVGQAARAGEDSRMADTMILCTVNTYEKTLTLTSMLRDTLVLNPWGGNTKLTSVYHMGSYKVNGDMNEKIAGSMHAINLTLNKNFGIEVDHNFEIDFDVFIKAIDLLGGVTLELTEAEAAYLNAPEQKNWVPYDVEPGWFHMDGSGALCYARMRKAEGDSESDIKRTARQRHVIERVINQMRRIGISELESIVKEVLPMVATSMSNEEITQTLVMMLKILPELKLQAGGTCPAEYWGEMVDIYSDGQMHSVLKFVPSTNTKIMRAITEGEAY